MLPPLRSLAGEAYVHRALIPASVVATEMSTIRSEMAVVTHMVTHHPQSPSENQSSSVFHPTGRFQQRARPPEWRATPPVSKTGRPW